MKMHPSILTWKLTLKQENQSTSKGKHISLIKKNGEKCTIMGMNPAFQKKRYRNRDKDKKAWRCHTHTHKNKKNR